MTPTLQQQYLMNASSKEIYAKSTHRT